MSAWMDRAVGKSKGTVEQFTRVLKVLMACGVDINAELYCEGGFKMPPIKILAEKLGEGELNGEEAIHALLEVGVEWRKPGLLSEQAYKFIRRHPLVLREELAHTAGVDLHAAEAPAAHRKM